ncbi:MAG: TatD family hydrolase [Ignavibacteriales bacterium]|nr:TatD family hydrolase [Ignavibacteriales bacterium]
MYVDSHAHLFYEDFDEDLPDVIQRAIHAGVEKIIVPGTTLETSNEAVGLAEKYQLVFACVGFHPHEASKATDTQLAEIESLSRHPKVVAIGEIGLDYHYDFSPRDQQRNVFRKQIQIAIRRNLPIVVHTRESTADAFEIVREVSALNRQWKATEQGDKRGVFHCFTGSVEEANILFGLGFYVSYPGIVTFKNSPVLTTLKTIGLGRILLETDSPYMAPVPVRGKRNEPANIALTAKKMAEVLGERLDEVARVTKENATFLFALDQEHQHWPLRT